LHHAPMKSAGNCITLFFCIRRQAHLAGLLIRDDLGIIRFPGILLRGFVPEIVDLLLFALLFGGRVFCLQDTCLFGWLAPAWAPYLTYSKRSSSVISLLGLA